MTKNWLDKNSSALGSVFLATLGVLVALLCGCEKSHSAQPPSHQVEPGVYTIPLELPTSLEPQRQVLERTVLNAQRRVMKFARQQGWTHLMKTSFADRVRIYDNKAEFDQYIIDHFKLDPRTKLPNSYSAGLEKRLLFAVSPRLYSTNYPQGVEKDFYEKLLSHEILHRLQIRRLNGNEDSMGPIWFFEGFATWASGQFAGKYPLLTKQDRQRILQQTKRGKYQEYGALFHYYTQRIPLEELIDHAGQPNFNQWLAMRAKETTRHRGKNQPRSSHENISSVGPDCHFSLPSHHSRSF